MWEACDTFPQFWIRISSTLYKLSITPLFAEVHLVFCVVQAFVMKVLQRLCAFCNLIVIKYIYALEGFNMQYVYGINLKIFVDFCQRWFRSKCFIQALVEGGIEREREKWHWYRRNKKNCIIFFMLILWTFLHLWYEEQSILFCSYTESGFVYSRVFQTNGLMRTRLNPDATKMIICTTGGYLIIIHNLDLMTMAQDLAGFKVICIRSLFAKTVL